MPKVIQMCATSLEARDGCHGPVDILRILTDEGEVWEQSIGANYGDSSWQRIQLPWEKPIETPKPALVPFSEVGKDRLVDLLGEFTNVLEEVPF